MSRRYDAPIRGHRFDQVRERTALNQAHGLEIARMAKRRALFRRFLRREMTWRQLLFRLRLIRAHEARCAWMREQERIAA